MANGWLIGVMVELAGEPVALRHFFAVGHADQAKAEWSAIDSALLIGKVFGQPGRRPGAGSRRQRTLRQVHQVPGAADRRSPRPGLALAPPLDHPGSVRAPQGPMPLSCTVLA